MHALDLYYSTKPVLVIYFLSLTFRFRLSSCSAKVNLGLWNIFPLPLEPEALWVEGARETFQEEKGFASWFQGAHPAGSCWVGASRVPGSCGVQPWQGLGVSSLSGQQLSPAPPLWCMHTQCTHTHTRGAFVAERLTHQGSAPADGGAWHPAASCLLDGPAWGSGCRSSTEMLPHEQLSLALWRVDSQQVLPMGPHWEIPATHEPGQWALPTGSVSEPGVSSWGASSQPQGPWLVLMLLFLYSSEFFPILTTPSLTF